MHGFIRLNELEPGRRATVAYLTNGGAMRRRLLDLGLVEGTRVECVGRSPGGDPSAYLIKQAVIAIRSDDAEGVILLAEGGASL